MFYKILNFLLAYLSGVSTVLASYSFHINNVPSVVYFIVIAILCNLSYFIKKPNK